MVEITSFISKRDGLKTFIIALKWPRNTGSGFMARTMKAVPATTITREGMSTKGATPPA